MQNYNVINTEYLFKSIENLSFIEISIYKAIKKKIEAKKLEKDSSTNRSKKNTKPKRKVNKKKYPYIRSKHAFLFNCFIYALFGLSTVYVFLLTCIGKLTLLIYSKFFKKDKVTPVVEEPICKVNTVKPKIQVANIEESNVIDFMIANKLLER